MYMSRVCDRDSARREAPRHKPPGSGVVHERSARAGIRPVARGSGDPLVCGRRAQQLTFIHSWHIRGYAPQSCSSLYFTFSGGHTDPTPRRATPLPLTLPPASGAASA